MPAFTHPEPHELLLEFSRDGEGPLRRRAQDSQQALLIGITMLIEKRTLLVGDRLSVVLAGGDANDVDAARI